MKTTKFLAVFLTLCLVLSLGAYDKSTGTRIDAFEPGVEYHGVVIEVVGGEAGAISLGIFSALSARISTTIPPPGPSSCRTTAVLWASCWRVCRTDTQNFTASEGPDRLCSVPFLWYHGPGRKDHEKHLPYNFRGADGAALRRMRGGLGGRRPSDAGPIDGCDAGA